MTTWFTADLHLGHANIIAFCGRSFEDVESMNRGLIDGWNAVVDDGDDVWVLGDFAMGEIATTLPMVQELRGRKILLAGNHDRCWDGHGRRAERWVPKYLDAGFDQVLQGTTTMELAGETALLCHFPYRGDSHAHDRYLEHRPVDEGAWLLHGHVHERWIREGRMINVGVDAMAFRPISEAEVTEMIELDASFGHERHSPGGTT